MKLGDIVRMDIAITSIVISVFELPVYHFLPLQDAHIRRTLPGNPNLNSAAFKISIQLKHPFLLPHVDGFLTENESAQSAHHHEAVRQRRKHFRDENCDKT